MLISCFTHEDGRSAHLACLHSLASSYHQSSPHNPFVELPNSALAHVHEQHCLRVDVSHAPAEPEPRQRVGDWIQALQSALRGLRGLIVMSSESASMSPNTSLTGCFTRLLCGAKTFHFPHKCFSILAEEMGTHHRAGQIGSQSTTFSCSSTPTLLQTSSNSATLTQDRHHAQLLLVNLRFLHTTN